LKNESKAWDFSWAFLRRTVRGFGESRFNKDTIDATASLGKGEMTILKDMESLDQEHEQYMQELKNGEHSE
jgi:hypothetical protein